MTSVAKRPTRGSERLTDFVEDVAGRPRSSCLDTRLVNTSVMQRDKGVFDLFVEKVDISLEDLAAPVNVQ